MLTFPVPNLDNAEPNDLRELEKVLISLAVYCHLRANAVARQQSDQTMFNLHKEELPPWARWE